MSFDEKTLAAMMEAVAEAKLEVILIGNAAAIIHGAPVLTKDVDFMVCEDSRLQAKLEKFAQTFGVALTRPYEPTSKIIRTSGRSITVDFVLALSSRKSFESVKSRATKVRIGKRMIWVASLEDVIAAKEAASRPKDLAALPVLRETLEVKRASDLKRSNKH